jgi:23S rRNA (cytosine1962-C5)-methyltransferase
MSELSIIRLNQKANARALRWGAPWVYSDEVVLDRRTKAIDAGTIVLLQDAERQDIALAAFNANSKIIARVLERNTAAKIDYDWLVAKLQRALALRNDLFDAPFYRLVHAEADGLPGVIIDRFGDAAVIQPNAAWAEVLLPELARALADVTGVTSIVKNATGRSRSLEGLSEESGMLLGKLDGPIAVPMNGATYQADLLGGQKTGLFYDQRPNHALAARLARGKSVLDVFAHVGGFSLAALANGAVSALAVDSSTSALDLATQGARLGGVAEIFSTQRSDAFDAMTSLAEAGRKFEVVICDPPAFAPNKAALEAGMRAYERVARMGAALVEQGGYLVLCSCSHAADLTKFRDACLRGIGKSNRKAQIVATGAAGPDHPTHPYLAESAYLKALFLRLD